ncbi:hypothetical protein K491DRAFT_437455 [Lophiostoma macrostomum CBS 122681]|uniref:Zn(2)-C6 fungal-type domain-containing protein n=1 Tax=Lophiostoma macrostomum CBS 122681 TaxID=1314788 RepID=A0A6A6T9C5_9PLEO|nr:hypothetical protein K491DRAFT_437455 [Lophiostoma macrostomum CBS 122681]
MHSQVRGCSPPNVLHQHDMSKRGRGISSPLDPDLPGATPARDGDDSGGLEDGPDSKKPRTFMATLACDNCRSRKSRCDEDRPKCGFCKAGDLECTYRQPRPTKKDQSMTVAINAIRRLEAKIEELTATVSSSFTSPAPPPAPPVHDARSPVATFFHPNPETVHHSSNPLAHRERGSIHETAISAHVTLAPGKPSVSVPESGTQVNLSFSQHGVALWPAIKEILPEQFMSAREALPREYIVEIESHRPSLPIDIEILPGQAAERWLASLPLHVVRGLSHAFFAVLHRNTPVLDRYHFFSHTLVVAMEDDFGHSIETCLLLNVLALGCLAVRAHEEGNFPLPSEHHTASHFLAPEWYPLVTDTPPGLRFFNEGRRRSGFHACDISLQAAQVNMLSTLYYAQILRPIDSWTTVNRAALCCISILKRAESVPMDSNAWESDVFSRVFWATLMYETIITQELNLPLSGLLEYEDDMPIPKFTPFPRPKTSVSTLLVNGDSSGDQDDAFFNFHFLAQAAHRILLTRIRHNLYTFDVARENSPTISMTTEMHRQLEQWRTNLPPALRFPVSAAGSVLGDDTPEAKSPAHVMAKAMLDTRYLVASFHIGRPFLYKALHAPSACTAADYAEIRASLQAAMNWPTTMGLPAQMLSALPVKFGWCCQCFGQVLLFHAVARSGDARLTDCLPVGWTQWVHVIIDLLERCGQDSPGVKKDAELLRLLL